MNSSKRGAVYGFKLQSLDLVSGRKEMLVLCEAHNSWQRLGIRSRGGERLLLAVGWDFGEDSPPVAGPVGTPFLEHHWAAST